MEAERQSTPGPDASFAVFTTGLPSFIPAISDGLMCILDLAAQVTGTATGAEMVIAGLTGSIAEDLQDVTILCARDRTNGAVRLLRTPYEKFLYASHISRHPETAEDFLQYDAIQAMALSTGIEKHWDHRISETGKAKLEERYRSAQQRFKRSKCKECGESSPRSWTKVTPEQMAKESAIENIHVLAYRYATLMIHPSFRGILGQKEETVKLPAVLTVVHKLTFETIKLQWLFFKRTDSVTGKAAQVLLNLEAVNTIQSS